MTKGLSKGPKPITCSKTACKKKWASMHMTFNLSRPRSWEARDLENRLIRENPDAWDGYFDSE